MFNAEPLYKLAIQTLVQSDFFESTSVDDLPGPVKEDILNMAFVRAKNKFLLSRFLHRDLRVLNTREYTISHEDLLSISNYPYIRVLQMNPPATERFNHPSNLLNLVLHKLPNLVKLSLQRNDGVTDGVMRTLVCHSCKLLELDISGCHYLTDWTAEALSTLPELRALNLSHTQVSDEGLLRIATGRCGLSLTELCVNNCQNIRGKSFKYVVKYCNSLRILGISGCPNLEGDGLAGLDNFCGEKKQQLFWTVNF